MIVIIKMIAILIGCIVHQCNKVQLVKKHIKVRVQYDDSYNSGSQRKMNKEFVLITGRL